MMMAINIQASWKEVTFARRKTEYLKRVTSALKSKLNAGNVFQAINIWAVPTI